MIRTQRMLPLQEVTAPMYQETIQKLADMGAHKASTARQAPFAFLIGAMMAGAYIGFGDIVMFSVSSHVDPGYARLIQGAVFSLALTIVIFAGSELFTSTAMVMPLAQLRGQTDLRDTLLVWSMSWIGNLLGAALLAALIHASGGGVMLTDGADLFFKVAHAKMSAPPLELLAKGILCNWLVCLAVWMVARTSSESTKLAMIFWPIFAFVAGGFEHSVANMFVFSLALLGPHPENITLAGAIHNEIFVTLGNLIGGSVFMALGYWVQQNDNESHATKPAGKPIVR
ncbi:formate/nitrite transporter family protein [Cupriavidus pampae]|uniref:Nitrite transporter NirC n=1 Tax=Cupriavidus pampae TaxID=659251 RepID=A0ABN7Y762_9BURK|nr:formate/nitrite transporter family protein [Cupriavidus pampae]CAG9169217.1 Nitrite transporter NirC [Cupriavidus pampae]